MAKVAPTVSVVIPAYDEEKYIARCLESIAKQTRLPFEVLVVDNLSTDSTVEVVREFQKQHTKLHIELVSQSAEQGLIPTRNYGISEAKGDVVGRIDADSTLEPGWVAAVQEAFGDPEVAAASGPIMFNDMPFKKLTHRVDRRARAAFDKFARKYRLLFGSNMAVRHEVWDELASELCLDKDDKLHEDIDIALHFSDAGKKIVYVRDMACGVSARRIEDTPRDYYRYNMRFENTYRAHGVTGIVLRLPMFIYLSLYVPGRLIRSFYDTDLQKPTLKKMRSRKP